MIAFVIIFIGLILLFLRIGGKVRVRIGPLEIVGTLGAVLVVIGALALLLPFWTLLFVWH